MKRANSEVADDWVEVKELCFHPKPPKKLAETTNAGVGLYRLINDNANQRLNKYKSPIFIADLDRRRLYDHFLDGLSEDLKREYSCNVCRAFVYRYGALAFVNDDGTLQPLIWSLEDLNLKSSIKSGIAALVRQFNGAKVLTAYKIDPKTRDKMESTTHQGGFNHLYLQIPDRLVLRSTVSREFARASTTELATMLARVLDEYSLSTVQRVTQILETDKLFDAHQHKYAAHWLLTLREQDKIKLKVEADAVARHNLVYRYAAESFVGCINQLRNGVLSGLLEAVEAGRSWDEIKRDWDKKTDPSQYLRPQEAPKAGNIAASERLFKGLGITQDDLRRRFLVLDDVPEDCIMWQTSRSSSSTPNPTSLLKLFAHITPKQPPARETTDTSDTDLPATRISFTNFITKLVPTAKRIEYKLSTHDELYFFITGHPNTKPLMQWHAETNTNRASWYVYLHPFAVQEHTLQPNAWNDVRSILPFPHLWDGVPHTTTFPLADEDATITPALNPTSAPPTYEDATTAPASTAHSDPSAVDSTQPVFKTHALKNGLRYLLSLSSITDPHNRTLCLFPAHLKSEFHGARKTIEAYSDAGSRDFVDDAEGKGGYVGGVAIERDLGKRGERDRHLLRVTDRRGGVGVWEIVLFE